MASGLAIGLIAVLIAPATTVAGQISLGRALGESGYESVPLRRTGQNHLFLFGKIEGRKRSCLIDTGWSFTTVNTNTAAQLAGTNMLGRLTLGSVNRTNVPTLVSDLRVGGEPTAYDVVLGCDFLITNQAIIDCGSGRLYLRAAGQITNSVGLDRWLSQAGWSAVSLQLRAPPALTCTAVLNGKPAELLVDCGAMWSCLDRSFVVAAGLRMWPSLNQISGPAVAGKRNYSVAHPKPWMLGSVSMPERAFAVLDLEGWGLGKRGGLFSDVQGILGGAELQANRAVIDFGHRILWLPPGP